MSSPEELAGRIDFVSLRGGQPDARPDHEKPYRPASYAAQYGIPQEDAASLVEKYATHGEVRARIYREYLSDAAFRDASLRHQVRPFGDMTKDEASLKDIFQTTEEQAERLAKRIGLPKEG